MFKKTENVRATSFACASNRTRKTFVDTSDVLGTKGASDATTP